MDAILTSTLLEQINEGNKGDGDFKTQAYQPVVEWLTTELSIIVIVDHARNRIKVWKKHYGVILKFKWDEERKMVVIPIEDLSAWELYNRVTGEGAEQHEESADTMEIEIEGASTSENSSGGSNKRLKRDQLVDAVNRFSESFKEYVRRAQGLPTSNSQEIYNVVFNVLGISRHQILRALKRFMNGTLDEFDMLKNLLE
ncbi:GMP synthase [glutamine-hydrolyzing] [Bienertia sinuspersici]